MNYQNNPPVLGAGRITSFGQVLNLYIRDRVFYSNDLTLGTFISRSKVSNMGRADMRYRFTANLAGHRYSLYSSLSPYTDQFDNGVKEKSRVFQIALTIRPRLLSDIVSSYTSNRQYTTDNPRSRDSFTYSWNVATQFSKKFGNFRGIYQEQQSKPVITMPQKQVQRGVTLAYDIAKQLPGKFSWAASYNFNGNRTSSPGQYKYTNISHMGAMRAGRNLGRFVILAATGTGRTSNFEYAAGDNHIQDFSTTASANFRLRRNISFIVLRGYSSNKLITDTTTTTISDYVNYSGSIDLDLIGNIGSRFSASRSIYLRSSLGHSTVDNGIALFDFPIYRQTMATANLAITHNNKTLSGRDRYQMVRSLDINSRPTPKMALNFNYQSTLSSNNITFRRSDNDNLSFNLAHTLKPYFNYSIGYKRSLFTGASIGTVSTLGIAVNYLVSSRLSFLGSYSRSHVGRAFLGNLDAVNSAGMTVTWNMSRRSSVTINYLVSGINSSAQTETFGGYFTTSF